MRRMRQVDARTGVKHSGIALDIALHFYEHEGGELSVQDITAATGYSGPTVRLVLRRLQRSKTLRAASRQGRTVYYAMTPEGVSGFDLYVRTLYAFAEAPAAETAIAEAGPAPAPGRRAGRKPLRAPHAAAPPDREEQA